MKDKSKAAPAFEDAGSSTLDVRKSSHSRRVLCDKPTPLDFDAFVPWVCLEWQMPKIVVVTRLLQEEYNKQDRRRSSSSRTKSSKSLKLKPEDVESTVTKKNTVSSAPSGLTFLTKASDARSVVPVKAYYDTKNHLVEISIIGCPFEIHKKVIQAFSICVPFHSLLTKLTIRKGGVTSPLLREIGKLLTHSNLTDLCLDDCIVSEGNYGVIIEQTSQLKNLSLNRCNIEDAMCKDLAAKMDFGSSGASLLILELGSNLITDKGVKAIGEILRRNRSLLHLNLSGNQITDDGAFSILAHLVEFRLTWNEIYEARKRKLKYMDEKIAVYERCLEEVVKRQRAELPGSTTRRSLKSKNVKKSKKIPSVIVEEKSAVEVAEAMTLEIVGKFIDPFDDNNVVKRDEPSYSKGNLVLCSLNLSYNNLTFRSIAKILEVLKYQDQLVKPNDATGLIRIVFDGNNIPTSCIEYDRIEMFLRKVITERAPISTPNNYHKKRTISAPASRRS